MTSECWGGGLGCTAGRECSWSVRPHWPQWPLHVISRECLHLCNQCMHSSTTTAASATAHAAARHAAQKGRRGRACVATATTKPAPLPTMMPTCVTPPQRTPLHRRHRQHSSARPPHCQPLRAPRNTHMQQPASRGRNSVYCKRQQQESRGSNIRWGHRRLPPPPSPHHARRACRWPTHTSSGASRLVCRSHQPPPKERERCSAVTSPHRRHKSQRTPRAAAAAARRPCSMRCSSRCACARCCASLSTRRCRLPW